MKILAIDTTAKTASISLAEFAEGSDQIKIIAEYTLETGTHSTTLLPMIESVFSLTSNTAADIDLYAVAAGPGSFTGIRIGVSAVKGLAFVKETPCIGVSSVDALAYGCADICGIIVPAIDARRETVYSALYFSDGKGKIEKLTDDCQIAFDDLLGEIGKMSEKYPGQRIVMPGDAYRMNYPKYAEKMADIDPCRDHAGAGAARAAAEKWNKADDRSSFTDAALCPMYLKKSQAEREREEMLTSQKEYQK